MCLDGLPWQSLWWQQCCPSQQVQLQPVHISIFEIGQEHGTATNWALQASHCLSYRCTPAPKQCNRAALFFRGMFYARSMSHVLFIRCVIVLVCRFDLWAAESGSADLLAAH